MGMKGTCRSCNRGGCPLSYAHYVAGIPFCPLVFPFPAYHQGKTTPKSGKSYILFGAPWCFLGKIGDSKRQNTNIFLKARKENRCGGGRLPAFWRAHLGRWSGNSCYFADVSKIGKDSAGRSDFRPLYCFAFGALPTNMPLFRVLRGFSAGFPCWMWVCVASMLFVACGAFVCVRG